MFVIFFIGTSCVPSRDRTTTYGRKALLPFSPHAIIIIMPWWMLFLRTATSRWLQFPRVLFLLFFLLSSSSPPWTKKKVRWRKKCVCAVSWSTPPTCWVCFYFDFLLALSLSPSQHPHFLPSETKNKLFLWGILCFEREGEKQNYKNFRRINREKGALSEVKGKRKAKREILCHFFPVPFCLTIFP